MPLSARLRAGARSAWRQVYAIRMSAGESLFKSNSYMPAEQHPEAICFPSIRCLAADDLRLYQNARRFQGFSSTGLTSRGLLSIHMKPGILFEQKSSFTSTASMLSKADTDKQKKETISVTFVLKDGEKKTIRVPVGMSMMEAAHENDIDLEGACEGSLACSTCHVIISDEKFYQKLPEPSDEENDMLDLAFGLTETSRLGCQVVAEPGLDGIEVALPPATRNFAVDGHVPKPH